MDGCMDARMHELTEEYGVVDRKVGGMLRVCIRYDGGVKRADERMVGRMECMYGWTNGVDGQLAWIDKKTDGWMDRRTNRRMEASISWIDKDRWMDSWIDR